MMLRFHTQTGGSTLTAQQTQNNVVRVTIQALAAVLGGTQSLHTNGMDEALSLPTELAARTALRTQQIIAHESGVTDTVDPLAGSYFVENLTKEIENKAMDYIERIDEMGGATEAIASHFFQNEIRATAYQTQKEIDRQDRVIVGVNRFQTENEERPELFSVDDKVRSEQAEKLKKLRGSRDQRIVEKSLEEIRRRAAGTENLMPAILHAVESYATLGEISDALRSVWGEYRE